MVRFFFLIFIFVFLCSCRESAKNIEVPIIHINPDAAESFVASDFFDGYRVFTFKDIICTRIGDFVEVGDKIVASSAVSQGFSDNITICIFDTLGHYLYPLGNIGRGPGEYMYISPYIELTKDSTILMKSTLGWVEYDLDGQLIDERRIKNPIHESLGYMHWRMNDSTLLFKRTSRSGENQSDACMLQLVSSGDFQLKRSFFPLQEADKYVTKDQFYVLGDTVCLYVDIEGQVYTVWEDRVEPRYVLDKGKYAALTPYELLKNEGRLLHSIGLKSLSENARYVIGLYLLGEKYYFFFYDKRLCKTYDLKCLLEDDLLLGELTKLYGSWKPGYRISDEYMYFHFTFSEFSQLMDNVRKTLSDAEWEAYQQKHPDLMRVYQELNEDSNTVVVGYKFKS